MPLGCQGTVVTIATLPPQREQKPQHPHLQTKAGGGDGRGSTLTAGHQSPGAFILTLLFLSLGGGCRMEAPAVGLRGFHGSGAGPPPPSSTDPSCLRP